MSNIRRIIVAATITAAMLVSAGVMAQAPTGTSADVLGARMNTLYGPTGLITVPTAYVTNARNLSLGTMVAKDNSFSANYGLTQSIEVGATYLDRDSGSNKTLVNAKVNIIPSNFNRFQLGLGVIDAADTFNNSAYIMASADWATPEALRRNVVGFRLHAGYGTGVFDRTIIGGAEFVFTPKTSLIAEYNGDRINAAFRYVHDTSFRIQGGIEHNNFFAATSYNLAF